MTEAAQRILEKETLHFRVYDPNELPALAPEIMPLIERACEFSNGELEPRSVLIGICDGLYGLLGIVTDEGEHVAVMVTEIVAYPTGERVMWCKAAGGRDVEAWVQFDAELDAVAKYFDCARLRMFGRKGWTKKLPHWRWTHVVLERGVS
jgi:hypothetical protein